VIRGPTDSPFEGFEFDVSILVNFDYPLSPPVIAMDTVAFHPNINMKTGEICLDILKKEWCPAW
jgi:peroxin-4